MKKLFIVTLAVLFAAGAAYAVEYDFSGMINTRGTYLDNDSGFEDKSRDYMFYDMEFDADVKIMPSDKTLIFLNMEIHDENFTKSPTDSNDKTGDDNIVFKRAYGKYTFDNGLSTTFGLMTGGAFGTAFGDNGDGYYRVRVDGAASFGNWGFILEKLEELGTEGRSDDDPAGGWDSEKDDSDGYAAYLVTKAGDVTLNFLAKYADVGDATGGAIEGGFEFEDTDIDTYIFVAAAMGSFGSLGFEAEFDVVDRKYDGNNAPEDYTVYGLYGNVWMAMDAAKIGGYAAYGSWDDDRGAGFDFGADFYFGEGVGESQAWGTGNKGTWSAVTLLGLYGDYAVNDAMSLYANFSYWMSNEDELADGTNSPFKDADGYEVTARGAYKLADNVTYSAGAAYGAFKPDEGSSPDPYIRAFHKIQINF